MRAGRSMVNPDSSMTSNPASTRAVFRRPTFFAVSLISRMRNMAAVFPNGYRAMARAWPASEWIGKLRA
ncbi:hypothetical protein D9M71_180520 [compost metagenome]